MEKLKIKEAIVVEGRDDTAAVKRAADALIIETHGFGIKKETWNLIQKAYENKWIVGLEYTGNPYDIDSNMDFKDVNVYVIYNALDFNEAGVTTFEEAMKAVNPALKVVVRTNENYSNMQVVKTLCLKYPNVSFMGGTFLKLPDCRFGEVDSNNLPKRIVGRTSSAVIISGDCSVLDIVQGSDVEYIFGNVPYVVKKKESRKPEKLDKVVEKQPKEKGTEKPVKKKTERPKKQVGASFATSEGLNCF